ncbi:branched-chain amino acid ABC transporter permease [Rhodopila sp.]|uniref:branched-chain amino acid ABC transporter permease n=1 Tax=Rhodopila sp. TaxID=2480087 RepID=UPI003D146617
MTIPDPAIATILHDSEAAADAAPALRQTILTGLLFGIIGIYLAAVGLLLMLDGRAIIVGVMTLGEATLLALGLGVGVTAARGTRRAGDRLIRGLASGAIAGGTLALLPIVMAAVPLRWIFIALSPALSQMLTFAMGVPDGSLLMLAAGGVAGVMGALETLLPALARRILVVGCSAVIVAGVFQELIQIMLQTRDSLTPVNDLLYTWQGLTTQGAMIVFVVAVALTLASSGIARLLRRDAAPPTPAARKRRQLVKGGLLLLGLVLLPLAAGAYIGQVMMLVGLYILMGMGLNLEVGLAGLLDLGFVAFFAVGAYATALLTGDNSHALAAMTFWEAMPIAVLCSVGVGVLFGLPVLGVRGDYLAVATLGLGEIVRVIVVSDFAAPLLGGAQGLLQIPRPSLFGHVLSGPVQLFYLTLVAALIAAWFAWRLENSRLGRAWMALRDDEDVAQALGINLVRAKLLAYGLGAAFAGLAGSIFATMLSSVYPSSFQLLISINVLALIIVGGMGSLPGVMVGAVALIGLPELLREFGEYRYLFYGAALVLMMRLRPEGLWPSPTRQRELHADDDLVAAPAE